MSTHLRDELDRLGDEADVLTVPADLWQRGRRARRRARAATAVVAASVALLLVGGATALVTADGPVVQPAGPAGDVGHVPGVVHLPPERLVQYPESPSREVVWDERVAEDDLAVGRAGVAFLAGAHGSLPVVVTAADGGYHALDLPDWAGAGAVNDQGGGMALELSPDGRSLAYAWWDPEAPLDAPMPAGVRVLDLATGEIGDFPLNGKDGVAVREIVWSPDSSWLAWSGEATRSWTPASYDTGHPWAGRIRPSERHSEIVPWKEGALAVDDDGVVTRTSGGLSWRWNGHRETRQVRTRATAPVGGTGSVSPDGSTVLLGSSAAGSAALFLDTRTSEVTERPLGKDLDLYPGGAEVHPLGWVDETLAVALVMPQGETAVEDEAQLVLMTSPSVPEESWTYRIVGHVDTSEASAFAPGSLSVAVDLMTLDEPTVSTERPEWPGAWGRWVPWAVGLLLLAGASVAFLRVRRRDLRRNAHMWPVSR